MDRRNYAFGKMNFLLLAIGVAILVAGFILVTSAGLMENTFFSVRCIKVTLVI